MRLIDADKFDYSIIPYLGEFCHVPLDDIISGWKKIADAQPTAYDVDEVMERLKEEKDQAWDLCDGGARYSAYDNALEIVRSGMI